MTFLRRASALVVGGALLMAGARLALAQDPAPADTTTAQPEAPADTTTAQVQTPADTTAAQPVTEPLPPDTTTTFAPRDSASYPEIDPPKRDRSRVELGAAKVKGGDYDFLGTLAYHRFLRKNNALEHWIHVELSGGSADHLTELALSGAYLFRPVKGVKRGWPIQPIFEFGPGFHLVNQIAEIEGFGENAFHTHVYLKAHAFAGFDIMLGERLGLVTRGRFTVPSHKPLDYAQIALFLR